jgi:transporter family-2 protein
VLSARYALWAVAAGALIPVMAVLNARLGRALQEPFHAPVILFSVGLVAMVIVSLVFTGGLPDVLKLKSAQPIDLMGGLIVAFYVLSVTILAPRFGVGNVILFAMVAQIVCSALIDHFGLLGAMVREISLVRLVGLALLLAGLFITQLSIAKS